MTIELRILTALMAVIVLVCMYMGDFSALLFITLFFGFYRIVMMHPKYEWLRERFETIF